MPTDDEIETLWNEYGVFAYTILQLMAEQEQREIEHYWYLGWTTWLDGPLDEEDDETDWGMDEPDDYGNDAIVSCLDGVSIHAIPYIIY